MIEMKLQQHSSCWRAALLAEGNVHFSVAMEQFLGNWYQKCSQDYGGSFLAMMR